MAIALTMNMTTHTTTPATIRPIDEASMMFQADNNTNDTTIVKRPLNESESHEEPATKKQRRNKRVSFATNNSVHTVSRVEKEDAPRVWYSADEFYHSRRCDAHWINFYSHCDDKYKQELFQVLGAACGKLPAARAPLVALSSSPARGLEREMTPCFRQRKKQVVGNVLQSQAALLAYASTKNIDGNNAHKGAEILANHYRKLALPATRFARLLGQGDAAAVALER